MVLIEPKPVRQARPHSLLHKVVGRHVKGDIIGDAVFRDIQADVDRRLPAVVGWSRRITSYI